ncbi:alpha/beta fold hydrolase [Nocardioides zhouii]|uniref:alpha/beta fold hydrolase n=1 Tax=Nocardioides zhouii TaxID=1168729 RepID=UPI0013E9F0E9|nr:alpha/beta fold hydrolase [Nocardioides zhouii]
MRPLPALIATCVVLSGCAAGSSGEDPAVASPSSSTSERTAEPAVDPAAPVADLHVECDGEAGPTVVLVAGLGTSGDAFSDLQDELAGTARTCFYDRAGIGDSAPLDDAAPDPSPGSAAADLRATLEAEDIEPPYVLLGWSYGGLVAQAYAADFPDDLAGLVLEDPSVREQFTDATLDNPDIDWSEGGRDVDRDALVRQLAGLDLGDLPVTVLSQDLDEPWIEAWWVTHDRLARATTDGVHAIGLGSGHAMHEDAPRLVARAVVATWTAAEAGTPLPGCREVFRGVRVRCRV